VGMGDFDAAHNAVTEANSLAERCGDYFTLSMAVWARAELESELGNVARSIELYEEMQRLGRALGSEGIGPWAESKIAETLTRSGRAEHALERLRAASDDFLRSSNLRGNTNYLAAYAVAFARTGQAERAATMLGAHWGHFIALGLVIEPESEDEWMQQNGLAEARDSLGEARWDRALEVGRAFTTEQAFAYAASEETRAKAP
jgi:hypothetical protein